MRPFPPFPRRLLATLTFLIGAGSVSAQPETALAEPSGAGPLVSMPGNDAAAPLPSTTSDAAAPFPAVEPIGSHVDASMTTPTGSGAGNTSAIVETDVTLVLRPAGGRLSTALAEFARDHGWELAWEIERDFPIDHAARFDGPFLDIIAGVVGSLRKTDAPVRAKVYRANKVVRIVHATR